MWSHTTQQRTDYPILPVLPHPMYLRTLDLAHTLQLKPTTNTIHTILPTYTVPLGTHPSLLTPRSYPSLLSLLDAPWSTGPNTYSKVHRLQDVQWSPGPNTYSEVHLYTDHHKMELISTI